MPGCWPVVRDAIRGYSQAEADKLSIPDRRKRTSRRVANGARLFYLAIQLVCLVVLFQSDSELGRSWRGANSVYAWSFLGLVTGNLILYTSLCKSDPGFLPVKQQDTESSPLVDNRSQQQGADQSDTTLPLEQVHIQSGTSSYQPLPYPTNYANYINPALVGRSSQDTPAVTTPWWDLPNPGMQIDRHSALADCKLVVMACVSTDSETAVHVHDSPVACTTHHSLQSYQM